MNSWDDVLTNIGRRRRRRGQGRGAHVPPRIRENIFRAIFMENSGIFRAKIMQNSGILLFFFGQIS